MIQAVQCGPHASWCEAACCHFSCLKRSAACRGNNEISGTSKIIILTPFKIFILTPGRQHSAFTATRPVVERRTSPRSTRDRKKQSEAPERIMSAAEEVRTLHTRIPPLLESHLFSFGNLCILRLLQIVSASWMPTTGPQPWTFAAQRSIDTMVKCSTCVAWRACAARGLAAIMKRSSLTMQRWDSGHACWRHPHYAAWSSSLMQPHSWCKRARCPRQFATCAPPTTFRPLRAPPRALRPSSSSS